MLTFSSCDPDDWRRWRHNFLLHAESKGWNDNKKLLEIASSMEGDAHDVVADITRDNKTPVQLLDAYEARFVPAAAQRMARSTFFTAFQMPGETLLRFHARLRESYRRAYPDRANNLNTDAELIDHFASCLMDKASSVQFIYFVVSHDAEQS